MAVDIGAIAPPKKAEIKTRPVKHRIKGKTRAGKYVYHHGRPTMYFMAGVAAPALYQWSSKMGFQVTTGDQADVRIAKSWDLGTLAVSSAAILAITIAEDSGHKAGIWDTGGNSALEDWTTSLGDTIKQTGRAILGDGNFGDIAAPGVFLLLLTTTIGMTGNFIQSEAGARRAA